jgi:hypothetical protein
MAKKNERDANREQAAESASEEPIVALSFIEINKQGQLVSRTEYLHSPGAAAPPQRLSGTAWVPIAFDRRRGELRAMSITDASRALAHESKTAPDCAKPLKARYIEKLLRDLDVWPKARRSSLKQRPK